MQEISNIRAYTNAIHNARPYVPVPLYYIVSTFPSFLSSKYSDNVSDRTCEDVLDGVDVGGSEKQEMKVGSNIAFEKDAESTKNEDSSGQLNMNSQIEGFKVP